MAQPSRSEKELIRISSSVAQLADEYHKMNRTLQALNHNLVVLCQILAKNNENAEEETADDRQD
jgi:hypothetical protein